MCKRKENCLANYTILWYPKKQKEYHISGEETLVLYRIKWYLKLLNSHGIKLSQWYCEKE